MARKPKNKGNAEISPAGKLCRETLEQFPSAGTLTLAKMLYRDYPEYWKDLEGCRSMLRWHRGSRIGHGRRTPHPIAREDIPSIPHSDAQTNEPYKFPHLGHGAIISDLHLPYHDKRAIELTLEYLVDKGATDWCLVLGDLVDCHTLSRFCRDPLARSFTDEIEMAAEMLAKLQQIFRHVTFKLGNHEKRYEDYLKVKAPELYGLSVYRFENLLDCDERKIPVIEEYRPIDMSGLMAIHGHEFGQSFFNPVNPARGLYLRAKSSTICGHYHQSSNHGEGDINRRQTSCWSIGCLCGLSPDYRPLAHTKWKHGFARVVLEEAGFDVYNLQIVEGKVRPA